MPDQTRDVLRRLAETMRRAGGIQATPASSTGTTPDAGAAPKAPRPAEPKGKSAPGTPERRAELPVGIEAKRP